MNSLLRRRGAPLSGAARVGLIAAVAAVSGLPAWAASNPSPNQPAPRAAAAQELVGDYLSGRHAQHTRDFQMAASWYEKAMAADPNAPELISRTFVMEVSVGHFDKAKALAGEALTLDPTDALAHLVLLVDRLRAGDAAGAGAQANALPQDGVHRFVRPLAIAWTKMAAGDLAGADAALQELDKFNGFGPLKLFQLGLLYDSAGQPDKAETFYKKAIDGSSQLNWRLTDVVANFEERQGRAEQAHDLYQRFLKQSSGTELAQSVLAARPPGPPEPPVRSASDGLAEALFDLASALNQAETVDLALVYVRFAVALHPQFPLAQLLLADVLSAQNKPEQSLEILKDIPANSPYYWSARLRTAVNLDTLDRTDEAIALLQEMAKGAPTSVGAEMQLGDIYRSKKRFAEAVEAYDEAIRRSNAAGFPERWVLYYDLGVALERSGQWERAESNLLHALDLKPDQPLVLNYLGYSWIDRKMNLDRGLKMIEKAVELRPEDGYIVDSLGWAHYRLGEYEKATEYLEKATELVPEDPTINDHLGDAYWQDGRVTEARYQWKRALQFGPQQDEIQPIEVKLEHGLSGANPSERGG